MLELYTSTHCLYCERVKAYMREAGIEYTEKNVGENTAYRDELIALGGKMQIPFLVDKNAQIHLYESKDIIEYLAGKYAGIPKGEPVV